MDLYPLYISLHFTIFHPSDVIGTSKEGGAMATYRKRGKKWFCEIKKNGVRTRKTFTRKYDAQKWASETERLIENEEYYKTKKVTLTLGQAVDKYAETVSTKKKGEKKEIQRLAVFKRIKWLMDMNINMIEGCHIAQFREERLKTVKAATVNRDLNLLSHIFTIAIKDWSMSINNPVLLASRPKVPSKPLKDRRRINKDDEIRISRACKRSSNIYLEPIFKFALETAMRRGELVSLVWSDVYIKNRRVFVRDSKTGEPRVVPLTKRAVEILKSLRVHESGLVFPFVSGNALTMAFRRACAEAKSLDGTKDEPVTGVRFHDTRHEATSRLFGKSLIAQEVKAVTGHKTDAMLAKYTDLLDEVIAKLG